MISPTLYLVLVYVTAVPLIVAMAVYKRKKSMLALVLILLLLAAMMYSGFRGIIAIVEAMNLIFVPILAFAIIRSAIVAVGCVRKWEEKALTVDLVATALGYYFLFLMIVFITAPKLRWCEGCIEWH